MEVKKETPFQVEFYASDSGVTMDYLSDNIIDIGITDTVLLDTLATDQGIIDRRETGWRDHWMLVGRKIIPRNSRTRAQVYSRCFRRFTTTSTLIPVLPQCFCLVLTDLHPMLRSHPSGPRLAGHHRPQPQRPGMRLLRVRLRRPWQNLQ